LGSWVWVIYIVLFAAIIYFMMIKPQQKARRAQQDLLSSLKKGDRVMTTAGIFGTVKRIEDDVVQVEIARGVTMKITRRAVAEIIRDNVKARATAPDGVMRKGKGAAAELEEAASEEIDTDSSEATADSEQDSDDSAQ
jgi:preprotein translocase subunit YajC